MPTKSIQPTHEDITFCAYLLWEQAGRPHGRADVHWQQAEAQLLAAAQSTAKRKTAARAAAKRRPFAVELAA